MVGKKLVTPNSVILVSGGARGITAKCVIKLAQYVPCKFILIGRTPIDEIQPDWVQNCPDDAELKRRIMTQLNLQGQKPNPQTIDKQFRKFRAQQEVEANLRVIRQAGAEVEYVNVDITSDIGTLQDHLAEPIRRMGKVSGLIHGAGTLADRRIEKKTAQDFEDVFSPKVYGLQNLLKVAPPNQLDFLILFSSVAGFFGNVGQADYAMANEVLNKAAFQIKREHSACHVVSINWGPWDSGMVTPELKRVFAEHNVTVIPSDAGTELLVKEIIGFDQVNNQPVQIVVGAIPSRPVSDLNSEFHHFEIRRHLSLDANPFLRDHQIGSHPVLPATCAASWVASSCEQLYPGFTFHLIEDFKVLKGIVFDKNLAQEHILDLKEIEKTPGEKVKFSGLIWSLNKNGRPLYHYSLNVTLLRDVPHAPIHNIPSPLITDGQESIQGEKLYQDGTLFHGPSFQGVQRVINLGDDHLIMECMLPPISPEQQGQFPLQTSNPFVYDAIVQSLLIWSQHYYQLPCLPSHLIQMDQYKAIPFGQQCMVDMKIISHNETAIVADIWVTNAQGEVYVKFHGLQGTVSPILKKFIGERTLSKLVVKVDDRT
jgi:NAD(P)-dependent dehydrogenase (short-subunit alcohol dehydrogenase family)